VNKSKGVIVTKTVEFLMDFRENFKITNIYTEENKVFFEFETELDVPENVSFQYETDEYGNIALVGLN
jgi:hypothetical protein